ncbi:Chitin synthase C [Penicillium cinerascens]|uniref:Chitin synthase C n=1 Tax=Penicillium cinerascens TaxID=70096 RepID=A0A9W9J9A7_9EURO|nr:Chitin synthase C [Penicillium cinerascens]KAJ5191631.1 Chitin synthase C [Penicillium cinerascens]
MTTKKQFFSTSSPWEARVGYYRAVRHGGQIYVAGSTAADPDSSPEAPRVRFPGDALQQTRVILQEIIQAIQAVGGRGAESIVRCKLYVSRKEDCAAVGQGFKDVLGKDNGEQIGAAATMIVVANGFVDDDMLVEIEVDAIAES